MRVGSRYQSNRGDEGVSPTDSYRSLLLLSACQYSEYIRITHDYPIAAAKAFSSLSNTGKFNFVYVSGEG